MTILNFKTIDTDGQALIHDTLRDNLTKTECNLIVDYGTSEVESRIGFPIVEVGEFDFDAKYTRLGARLLLPISCTLTVHTRTAKELRTLCNKVLEILDENKISFELDYNLYNFSFKKITNTPIRLNGQKYHSADLYVSYSWQSTTNASTTNGVTT